MSEANANSRRLTLMAMLTAMAYVAMLITRPLPAVAGFLSYDLKDVIIAVGGFILGPAAVLLVTLAVSLIEMITVSSTGPIGLLMNVLSTTAFALPAAMMYRRDRSLRSAATGLGLGVVLMAVVMVAWNYIITPLYMKVPREVVAKMLLPTFLPFNLVKGGLNAGITMLLYKPLSGALRRLKLAPASTRGASPRRFNLPATLISAVVVITCVLLLALMARG